MMPEFDPVCPKCDSPMEAGHVPDLGHGMVLEARWSRGEPEERRFVGGIKWKEGDQIVLVAYRCVGCGFVEFYARPE